MRQSRLPLRGIALERAWDRDSRPARSGAAGGRWPGKAGSCPLQQDGEAVYYRRDSGVSSAEW